MAASNGLFDLTGHVALVTGGGYGLGRGLVHGLAAHGATVIGLARSEDALRETFSTLGAPHRYIVGDLTTDALYEELDQIPEHVDIVVNNAGGDPHSKPWGQQTTQEWRDTYEINVIAAERLCALFIPKMAARGWGRVINISSIYGSIGQNPDNTGSERGCWRVHRSEAWSHRPDQLPGVPDRSHRRDHQHPEPGDDHLDGDA